MSRSILCLGTRILGRKWIWGRKMDKKVSIYANWKYSTFDRVLARISNLDVWEPGFYSRTVTLPDGSVGHMLCGSQEFYYFLNDVQEKLENDRN